MVATTRLFKGNIQNANPGTRSDSGTLGRTGPVSPVLLKTKMRKFSKCLTDGFSSKCLVSGGTPVLPDHLGRAEPAPNRTRTRATVHFQSV